MNTKQLLSMLMALPFVQGTFASEYIACNGCSLSQMTNVARAHGVGRYVVGDITGNKVEALRVQSGIHGAIPERMTPHGINQVVFDNLTPAEVQAFSYYRDFYHAAPAGYKKHYNLIIVRSGAAASTSYNDHVDAMPSSSGTRSRHFDPMPMGSPAPGGGEVSYPEPGVNAYDVVNGGPAQNAFLAWIGRLPSYGIRDQSIAAVTALSVFHIADSSAIPELTFTVTFTDGSHIGVYVDTTEHPPQLEVDPDTAVDSHGNKIPASASAVAGNGQQEYDFTGSGNGTDGENMRNQIGAFGIDPPASHRYKCTSFPVKGGIRVHCVAY